MEWDPSCFERKGEGRGGLRLVCNCTGELTDFPLSYWGLFFRSICKFAAFDCDWDVYDVCIGYAYEVIVTPCDSIISKIRLNI